jgi:hypothetical protein
MVFWAVAAPGATSADSLIGGWVWVTECTPCWGNADDNCLYFPWPAVCTSNTPINLCDVSLDADPPGDCDGSGWTPCDYGNDYCTNMQDTYCDPW